MPDLIIRQNAGPGVRYRNIEDSSDTWHWDESPTADASGGIPYAFIASLGDVSQPAPFLYTVELDIADADLREIFRWYEEEHLPMLTSCPGCIGGTRYRRLDGGAPNLLAAYRFETPQVNQTPEWIAARSTAWTDRVRPMFRAQRRYIRQSLV